MRKGLWLVTLTGPGEEEEVLVEASTRTEAGEKGKTFCYNYGVSGVRAVTGCLVPDLSIYKNGNVAVEI